ncbi:hypothetical protein L917_04618 [Phytophthora nicotianae]|uniref:Uncharacterized protein n=1 Tax=Phytophthora nicotianae TaxID=4792 RepID=W2LNT4_PHYNI|nr:hypothetical protein L917_04618 [Phytophthora nicotianae]
MQSRPRLVRTSEAATVAATFDSTLKCFPGKQSTLRISSVIRIVGIGQVATFICSEDERSNLNSRSPTSRVETRRCLDGGVIGLPQLYSSSTLTGLFYRRALMIRSRAQAPSQDM